MDNYENLQERIERLKSKMKPFLDQKKLLKLEVRKWVEKRNVLNADFQKLRDEVLVHKKQRDTCNKKVKDLKERLNILYTEFKEKQEKHHQLRRQLPSLKPQAQKENTTLKKIEALEWRIQTTPMNIEEVRSKNYTKI